MINQLVNNIKKLDAPIVVGLDPMLDYVPEYIKKAAFAEYGETLEGAAEAIWQYNKGIIDATYDLIQQLNHRLLCMNNLEFQDLLHLIRHVNMQRAKVL